MYLGIDIGTSGVKVVVADGDDHIHASASYRLEVSRPHPGWSEQHPDDWWTATRSCFDELALQHPDLMNQVRGIGLSGQMLGAVVVDDQDRALRSGILWNDGRALEECDELLRRAPDIGHRSGCTPDPGFTAPKLLWLAKHEPEVFAKTDCVMLPKDFVRLRLTGKRATEPSDGCGMLVMETESRRWSDELCKAAGWSADRLPPIIDSWASGGDLLPDLAAHWKIPAGTPVAAGAGDNMAASVGVGVARPGDAIITIGTSGVVCIVDSQYRPLPDKAVLTHAHAAPEAFLSMGCVMAATASVDWVLGITGKSLAEIAGAADRLWAEGRAGEAPVMLPFLNGIRTPHNRPATRGLLAGLSLSTDLGMLGWAVMEGVSFQFIECLEAQAEVGLKPENLQIVGGGAQNRLWCQMIASLLDRPVDLPSGRDVAASLGAARLGRVAAGDAEAAACLSAKPASEATIAPDTQMRELLLARYERYLAFQREAGDLL
ncbi:xylulokinase [Pelagibius sp.]|uniref:xylulokinase n=1 Tax=Pelagibius sp. TaxID=1931238 RepID=UPI003B5010FC